MASAVSRRTQRCVLATGLASALRNRRRFDPADVLHYAIDELGHSQGSLRISSARARARPKSWLDAAGLPWR